MIQRHSKILLSTIIIAIGAIGVLAILPVGAADQSSDYAILLLRDQPMSSYQGNLHGLPSTMPAPGAQLDVHTPAAVAYAGYLASQQALARSAMAHVAPQVQVLYEYNTVLNGFAVKLNGFSLPRLVGVGGIVDVAYSYNLQYDMNRSNALIGSPTLWAADGGQSNAGAGIKIGIIDTGIDFTHPFLTDNSLIVPAGYPKCDALDSADHQANTACKYVSNKVLVAKMFCTQAVCSVFDAQAKQDHGSHVSGIAAGVANTCAPFVGCTMSGVAPKAFLGNYNVFPGNVTDASSIDIAAAVDAAVADGMNVLNLSLGGTRPTMIPS
ncbi:MAG TPA: S8 family serine peptidase [Terriglobales bacterium]|nr:S8 family serine peptidase [Terriglobales bacterium]